MARFFRRLFNRACIHFGFSTTRQLRMWWLLIFRHTYVVRKLLTRKGKCTHGECAKLFCGACEWLVEKDGKYYCKNYENAPMECRLYPIDERVLEIRNKECREKGIPECGFYWEKTKKNQI